MRPPVWLFGLALLALVLLARPFESGVESLLPNPVYLLLVLLALALGLWTRGRRRSSRRRVLLAGLVLWAYALTTPGVARLLLEPLEQFRPAVDLASVPSGGDIVLLTSGTVERHGGKAVVRLDRAAWERSAASAALWKRTQGRLLVVGGPVMDGLSPARAMADAAIAWGVPAERVAVDDQARTTWDSFDRLPAVAPGQPAPWLVTSASHMRRALLSAEDKGWRVRAFPCDFIATDSPGWLQWLPSTYAYRTAVVALHEWVGLAYYHLRRLA